jgi:predicted alpha/beta superfamily hydrolase
MTLAGTSTSGKKRKYLLTVFLMTPLAAVTALVWIIVAQFSHPPQFFAPPVGAGAGSTGGANAIGEHLFARGGRKPDRPAAADPKLVAPESLPQGFVLVVEDLPRMASATSPIYFAGSTNSWNPGNPSHRLAAQSDMRWRIVVPQPAGWKSGQSEPIEFKFTRGTWELEELDADLNPIPNRRLPKIDVSKLAPNEQPVIELKVVRWGDERPQAQSKRPMDPYRSINATGTVRRLQVVGGSGGSEGLVREALVWLPPGYDAPEQATRRYPVLYLNDGQNVFEQLPGVPGEWKADEAASQLIGAGRVEPFIMVAIPNSPARMREYLPADALKGVQPDGARYVEFLVNEVMPRVNRAFRTDTAPARTAIGGSSLGAAISLYATLQFPDRFGMLLAESLPLRTGRAEAWKSSYESARGWPSRVFLGMGGKELGDSPDNAERNTAYVDAVRELDGIMKSKGVPDAARKLVVSPESVHNENAWSERFPAAIEFLFPAKR